MKKTQCAKGAKSPSVLIKLIAAEDSLFIHKEYIALPVSPKAIGFDGFLQENGQKNS